MSGKRESKLIFAWIITLLFTITVSYAQEFPGGGRPSTDGFLVTFLSTDGGAFQQQGDILVSSPPPTSRITIRFGPTTDPITFKAELDRVNITHLFSRTETGVTATLATTFDRHVLVVEITGVLPTGRSARDRDRLRFSVAPDTVAPALTIASPQSGQSEPKSPIAVEGTITDNIAVVTSTISLNDQTPVSLAIFSNGLFSQDVQLAPGANTIWVAATDKSGNSSQATVMVTFTPPAQDTTPPDVLLRSPANNATISGTSLILQG